MTDRDFKLLVREYFQQERIKETVNGDACHLAFKQSRKLKERILSELERFTREEIESLPFKNNKE
jgi:hypothetical protein